MDVLDEWPFARGQPTGATPFRGVMGACAHTYAVRSGSFLVPRPSGSCIIQRGPPIGLSAETTTEGVPLAVQRLRGHKTWTLRLLRIPGFPADEQYG